MYYFYNNNWYIKKGNKFYPVTLTSSCLGTVSKYPVDDTISYMIENFGKEKEPSWRDK